jgi:hypothetical protein
MDDRHTDTNKLLKKVHKVETLPNDFGKEVMEFAKISSEAYHDGVLQGELKVLRELRDVVQSKLNDAQARYDKTTVGAIMKKARDG